ncbi:hypothetical protein, partial [Acinetobacter terrestris]|uniref:hypothetical protein n=1 Tax=Acinetobacter terrestris TaxID=2529843 RepID=UPI001BC88058
MIYVIALLLLGIFVVLIGLVFKTRIQIPSATHLYLVEKVRCIRIIRLFQLAIGKHTMKQYTQLSQEERYEIY